MTKERISDIKKGDKVFYCNGVSKTLDRDAVTYSGRGASFKARLNLEFPLISKVERDGKIVWENK